MAAVLSGAPGSATANTIALSGTAGKSHVMAPPTPLALHDMLVMTTKTGHYVGGGGTPARQTPARVGPQPNPTTPSRT